MIAAGREYVEYLIAQIHIVFKITRTGTMKRKRLIEKNTSNSGFFNILYILIRDDFYSG